MNFSLARQTLSDTADRDLMVSMLIQGEKGKIARLVEEVGGNIKCFAGDIVSVTISINQLSQIITNPAIRRVEAYPPRVQPLSDSVLCHNNVLPVHNGESPLSQSYDGTGVIIGFIDTGIDFDHPDFQDALGNSRILWLWDHTIGTPSNPPAPYGYGEEWSNTDIDLGSCTHNPAPFSGHGTHVAGVATGNSLATGQFLGTAPNADIVFVALDFNNPQMTDAVSYIYTKALAAGKPCVINASLGSDYGLHDGKDLESQAIKNLINQNPGQAFVAAAGNSGAKGNIHLAYTVNPVDTNFTLFSPVSGYVWMKIVADSNSLKNIRFSVGADKMAPTHSFRGNIPFTTVSSMPVQSVVSTNLMSGGNPIGLVQYYLDTLNGDWDLEYFITPVPDSLVNYNWRLMATGNGSFDLWNYNASNSSYYWIVSSLSSSTDFPDSIYYKYPDADKSIQGGFQCLDEVICVASYTNRQSYFNCGSPAVNTAKVVGQRESISSVGPTRDNRYKPDIASPGDMTMAASVTTSCALHRVSNGTSNACPGVSGIAALYLQKTPTATATQVRDAIRDGAYQDFFTGSTPNKTWGYGKADAFATLTGVYNTYIQPRDTAICENANAVFVVGHNGTGITYQWQEDQGSGFVNLSNTPPYSGVTTTTLTVSSVSSVYDGYKYRCMINNPYSCNLISNIATLTVNPVPTIMSSSVADTVCYSGASQSSSLAYSATTNSPDAYSITWDATATGQGFTTVTDAVLAPATITLNVPAGVIATIYTGTLTVKTAAGCTSTSGNSFTLSIDTLPLATAGGTATICSNSSATVSGANANPMNIVWTENGAGSITSGGTTLTPTYTAAAGDSGNAVMLTMTVSNTNTCGVVVSTANYTVNVDGLPMATAGGTQTVCESSTANVSGATAQNGSIAWTENGFGSITSGSNSVSPVYTPASGDAGNAITLTMTVTSTNGCVPATASALYTINVIALPTATAGGSQTICENEHATVSGASATNSTILWTENGFGSITSGANTLTPIYASASDDTTSVVILTMTATATNSCAPATATATYSVVVTPLPFVTISGLNSDYCFKASPVSLTANPAGGIFSGGGITDALNGVFDPVFAGSGSQTVTYTYTDANNCTNSNSITTTVLPEPAGIDSCTSIDISYNTFTPNGDGINDVFLFDINVGKSSYSAASYGNFKMTIYNRWGDVVHSSYSPEVGWDGRSTAGEIVTGGTYYYLVEFAGKQYKGFVTLIR